MSIKSRLTDAARYWERKRIIYNLILAVLAIACWAPDVIPGGPVEWGLAFIVLLLFAIAANTLFCFAYPLDLLFQLSPLEKYWRKTRWTVFSLGLALASALALYVLIGSGPA